MEMPPLCSIWSRVLLAVAPAAARLLPGSHVNQQTIRDRVRELAPWFHNFDLRGVTTAPEHFLGNYPEQHWQTFEHAVPTDLSGRSVLDVGCNAGYFSIKMKQR